MCSFVLCWRLAQVSCSTIFTDGVPLSAKACQPTKSHVHARRDDKIYCANNSIPFLCLIVPQLVQLHTILLIPLFLPLSLSLFFPPSLLLIATMHFVRDTVAMLLSVVPSVDKKGPLAEAHLMSAVAALVKGQV